MNVLRTADIDASLQQRISPERPTKYLVANENNLNAAISLYERNIRLSEALYTPLQSLEICLRNTIDAQMKQVYGPDWLTGMAAPFAQNAKDTIDAGWLAFNNRNEPPTAGDLIAELKFSFWVSLLGPGYDESIWRKALYKCFQNGAGRKRSLVHGRLNAIRRFRNRVAHHEPIFNKAHHMHAEIIETIGWMCPDTQAWTLHHSRFDQVFVAP